MPLEEELKKEDPKGLRSGMEEAVRNTDVGNKTVVTNQAYWWARTMADARCGSNRDVQLLWCQTGGIDSLGNSTCSAVPGRYQFFLFLWVFLTAWPWVKEMSKYIFTSPICFLLINVDWHLLPSKVRCPVKMHNCPSWACGSLVSAWAAFTDLKQSTSSFGLAHFHPLGPPVTVTQCQGQN